MFLRFQKAAVRGDYEAGNQAFSMRLRFLTIRAGEHPAKRRCRTATLTCSLVYVLQHSSPEQSIRSGLVALAMSPEPEDHIGVEPKC